MEYAKLTLQDPTRGGFVSVAEDPPDGKVHVRLSPHGLAKATFQQDLASRQEGELLYENYQFRRYATGHVDLSGTFCPPAGIIRRPLLEQLLLDPDKPVADHNVQWKGDNVFVTHPRLVKTLAEELMPLFVAYELRLFDKPCARQGQAYDVKVKKPGQNGYEDISIKLLTPNDALFRRDSSSRIVKLAKLEAALSGSPQARLFLIVLEETALEDACQAVSDLCAAGVTGEQITILPATLLRLSGNPLAFTNGRVVPGQQNTAEWIMFRMAAAFYHSELMPAIASGESPELSGLLDNVNLLPRASIIHDALRIADRINPGRAHARRL